MKNVSLLCAAMAMLLALSACGQRPAEDRDPDKLTVVATVFPAYDFARAAGGDLAEVQLLLPPGTESHSYEPTPADILAVQDCDLFLYLGGESDTWVETILESVNLRGESLRMVDCVPLLEEETVEGMESYEDGHDHEHDHSEAPGLGEVVGYDEHVWTSPQNAAAITRAIGDTLAALDPANAGTYAANAEDYAAADREEAGPGICRLLRRGRGPDHGVRRPVPPAVFRRGIRHRLHAAFPGCSTQTEPSAATIAFLTDKVRQEHIPTVWYIEFSNHLVADSIAESAGVRTAMFHTCHNVSAADLEAGATYLSLMEQNLETLREYL